MRTYSEKEKAQDYRNVGENVYEVTGLEFTFYAVGTEKPAAAAAWLAVAFGEVLEPKMVVSGTMSGGHDPREPHRRFDLRAGAGRCTLVEVVHGDTAI